MVDQRASVAPTSSGEARSTAARATVQRFLAHLIGAYGRAGRTSAPVWAGRPLTGNGPVRGKDAGPADLFPSSPTDTPDPRLRSTDTPDPQLQSLLLAEAAVRYVRYSADELARPPQVAVLGPTQTGKSTLVNLLLRRRLAEVSPLAGFTVHAHGFWVSADAQQPASADGPWMAALFPGWRRCDAGQLTRNELESYAVTRVPPAASPSTSSAGTEPGDSDATRDAPGQRVTWSPGHVLWDTPDFDSLAARKYERGVLEVAALADVYVLVLSTEKYSDLSAWRMLELLEPLGRPLVIVLNKLTPDAEQAVVDSLRARLAERGRGWGAVPIVVLPYEPAIATDDSPEVASRAQRLREIVQDRIDAVLAIAAPPGGPALLRRGTRMSPDSGRIAHGVPALLRKHWDEWLAPIRAEHAAFDEWHLIIAAAAAKFLAAYQRDYLDHLQRYDSFRRAAIELLNLLEIPKIGGVLTRARQVVTWPARQAAALGRAWWRERRPFRYGRPGRGTPDRARAGTPHSLGPEAAVLVDTFEALLTGLQRDVLRRCTPGVPGLAVWQALARKLDAEEERLQRVCAAAIHAHHEQVTREVQATAYALYEELRKQPARLAILRTARATIDAGSVLLAVKTAGLSALDAVWAPAMFALSSLLMEGFAGLELGRAARGLKARQRQAVEDDVVQGTLVRELHALADHLVDGGLLATTQEQLAEATQALAAWEAGA